MYFIIFNNRDRECIVNNIKNKSKMNIEININIKSINKFFINNIEKDKN
jgi:hypothetical protein